MSDLIPLREKPTGFFDAGDVFDAGRECSEAGSAFVLVAEGEEGFESFFELSL